MERLTPKDLHPYEVKNFVDKFNDKGNNPYFRSKVIDKLWEYENAEEQGECKTAYDENHIPYMVEATGSEAKHIIELLTMEAQGLLLVLPVKIDQDIYVLKKAWWEDNFEKTKIVKQNFTLAFFCDPFNEWKFGEDYFLTEAEALQALKERE